MANTTTTPTDSLYIEPDRGPEDHAAEEVKARYLASRYQLEFVDLEHFPRTTISFAVSPRT
jgi:hypothetical protein